MKNLKPEEIFAETVSAVNFSNGVVRLFFSGHDVEGLLNPDDSGSSNPETRFCVTMPLPGFLYAISVVQGFVENEKFQDIVRRSVEAGFIPVPEAPKDPKDAN